MALHVCWAFQIRILLTLLVFSGFIVDYILVALHLLDLFSWTYSEEGLQCYIRGINREKTLIRPRNIENSAMKNYIKVSISNFIMINYAVKM